MLGGLTRWDREAIAISERRPDQDLREFDLTLWSVLSALCNNNPDYASRTFGLTAEALSTLANATTQQLSRLSSGVVLSFMLATPEDRILKLLAAEYEPIISSAENSENFGQFDIAYWLLMKSAANRHSKSVISASFGVSRVLVSAVAEATDNQLRHVAQSTCTVLGLRFSSVLIPSLIRPAQGARGLGKVLKKHQQALSVGRGN